MDGKSTESLAILCNCDICRVAYSRMNCTDFKNRHTNYLLEVHKIENFFDSDYGICVISFLVMSKKILRFYKKTFLIGPLLGEVRFFRIVLGLRKMKKNFEVGNFFFFFFNYGP
jgi:hypothetical protein